MNNHILSSLLFCLCTSTLMWTGCQEEEKSVPVLSGRDPMTFCTDVQTRASFAASEVTSITDSIWLMVTTASGDTLYSGAAVCSGDNVELTEERFLTEGVLYWPEDDTESVNIVAMQSPQFTYKKNPMLLTLGDFTGMIPDYLPYTHVGWRSNNSPDPIGDLVAAHVITSRDELANGRVTLTFKHLLAAFQASTKVVDTDYLYRIEDFYVAALKNGAYYFSPTDVSADGWVDTNTTFRNVLYEYLAQFYEDDAEGLNTVWNSVRYADFLQTNWEYYYLIKSEEETQDYYELGGHTDDYVSLTKEVDGADVPLSTFVIPVNGYDGTRCYLSYSAWTMEPGPSEGVYTPGEKVQQFSPYFALPEMSPGHIISLRLKISGLTLEFVDNNEDEDYMPE
ncbi:MAG: hypothetical protein J6Y99_06830 [Bacteroidales bacterium]|nr:hypothetical protein [Bacteroidales bacterium]